MARKTTKANPTNANEGMEMIMATEPQKTIGEAAEFLGVAEIRVLELFANTLNQPEAMGWETIPPEYEHLLNQFKSEASNVQALPQSVEPQQEPQPEPQPQPKKRQRRNSSALTKEKTEAVQETRQAATDTGKGVTDALTILQAQAGLQDGANAATAYLAGYTTNLTNIKGAGLTQIAGQMLVETADKSKFNPNDLMQQLGVPLSADTQAALNEVMGQVLGKATQATQEMTETAWGNGYNPQDALSALDNLMNSNG